MFSQCWFCLLEHPLFPRRLLSCREDAQELQLGSLLPLEVISLFVCLGGILEGFFLGGSLLCYQSKVITKLCLWSLGEPIVLVTKN